MMLLARRFGSYGGSGQQFTSSPAASVAGRVNESQIGPSGRRGDFFYLARKRMSTKIYNPWISDFILVSLLRHCRNGLKLLYHPRWRSNDYRVAWDVPGHHRACTNCNTVTYCHSRQYHGVSSNPAIISNCDFFRIICTVSSQLYRCRVCCSEDTDTWTKLRPISNSYDCTV